jgi:uncharacterized repeat protein (TIGR03843 family)
VSGDERALSPTRLSDPAVPRPLALGAIELLGQMPNASNATFLVRCAADGEEVLAIYKPRRGETPLWDFPDGTLHRREVAAYVTARALGWPDVPPTVLRDGPAGPGSVQLFVDADPSEHFFTLEAGRAEDFRRVALFDALVNNADRKAGHCLLGPDGRIWLVDHGVCFAAEPKLRTVIWTFAGDPIAPNLRGDLARVGDELEGDDAALRRELAVLLAPEEVEATARRARRLADAGRFPDPGPGRPFPWPPI